MASWQQFTADLRYLVGIVARKTGFTDPVLFDADDAYDNLLRNARGDEPLPFDGVLIRSWEASYPQVADDISLGMRIWESQGIRFASVVLNRDHRHCKGLDFLAVERRDYAALRKIAHQLAAQSKARSVAPVMPAGFEKLLWDNTIGFPGSGKRRALSEIWPAGASRRAVDRTARQRQNDGLPLDLGRMSQPRLGAPARHSRHVSRGSPERRSGRSIPRVRPRRYFLRRHGSGLAIATRPATSRTKRCFSPRSTG